MMVAHPMFVLPVAHPVVGTYQRVSFMLGVGHVPPSLPFLIHRVLLPSWLMGSMAWLWECQDFGLILSQAKSPIHIRCHRVFFIVRSSSVMGKYGMVWYGVDEVFGTIHPIR